MQRAGPASSDMFPFRRQYQQKNPKKMQEEQKEPEPVSWGLLLSLNYTNVIYSVLKEFNRLFHIQTGDLNANTSPSEK